MQELELLHTIHPIWLNRTVQTLAKGAGLRENLRTELDHFFSLMEQAIETGDPAWMDSIITLWVDSLTQSDLEETSSNLTKFINQLLTLTLSVCQETLDEVQTLELLEALLPCFTYCYEKAAQYEIQTRTDYVSSKLVATQQTLEKIDRSKSDFIAVAAHELKTPLTLVEGYATMLYDTQEKNNPESLTLSLVAGIRTGTRRLHAIIDDMIDVSMIDNNLLSINFQPVWLNRMFAVLVSEVHETIQQRKMTLSIIPYYGSDEMTFGDPDRLMQVYRNVLMNAIKYTPDGGQITVDGRKLPGFVETIIQDNGIGIAAEDQALIFDKFARVGSVALHSSGKTKFKGGGPGLGLHIARGIIEAHGGSIWVESPGRDESSCPGSTFHIILPLRSQPPDDRLAKLLEPLGQSKNPVESKG